MRKRKKNKENVNNLLNIDEKIEGVKSILNSMEQIFIVISPLMERFLLMENAKIYLKIETIDKLKQLLDNISKECEKLAIPSFNFKVPIDLAN